ncbi:MAG: hypothetical protein IT223_00615 [Crocinitomicaceae bacterium]|nr:hypothetical protein [Crocinitomicaceae bacterium]
MAKLDSNIKEEIALLSKPDLVKLVMKAASGDKHFLNYLMVNYIDKSTGEQQLFDRTKSDLQLLFNKSYKGLSDELQFANMLAACNKRINEFAKICKNKSLEMELILLVLEIPFSFSTNHFTTCFTRYNQQVYLLIKKAITLMKNKLNEDYHIEFAPKINEYLHILHGTSDHLDYIYALPESI